MNESSSGVEGPPAQGVADEVAAAREFRVRLAATIVGDSAAGHLQQIRALEELKNAICARQARLAVAAHAAQACADRVRVEGGRPDGRTDQCDRDASTQPDTPPPTSSGASTEQETRRLVASQLALARRTNPYTGSRLLHLAHALADDLPHTLAAMQTGIIGERQALLIRDETDHLPADTQREVDRQLEGELGTVADKQLRHSARAHGYRLAPHLTAARRSTAAAQRHVRLLPASDCMGRLTALLPLQDAAACLRALHDLPHPRPKGSTETQAMADLLVERITGTDPVRGHDIALDLLMPLDTLIGDEPATLAGHGPIPADLARELACPETRSSTQGDAPNFMSSANPASHPNRTTYPNRTDDPGSTTIANSTVRPDPTDRSEDGRGRPESSTTSATWRDLVARLIDADSADAPEDPTATSRPDPLTRTHIRRVFTHPASGDLIAMESRARAYPGLLAHFITLRDQICRTPWCGAPIRHTDHIREHALGGATSERNGQGLCARCNYVKNHPAWLTAGWADSVHTTTAGLAATSRPPRPPGASPDRIDAPRSANPLDPSASKAPSRALSGIRGAGAWAGAETDEGTTHRARTTVTVLPPAAAVVQDSGERDGPAHYRWRFARMRT